MKNFKETPAQSVALHTIQSLLLSALITLLVGILQYVGLHGLDWRQLALFASGSFAGQMTMVWKTLAGNPSVLQAVLDTLNEIKGQVIQSPVTIHNNIPAPAVTPAQAAEVQPAQATQFAPLSRSFTGLEIPAMPTQPQPVPAQ